MFETLESQRLLAASLTDGVLTVYGTLGDDTIDLRRRPAAEGRDATLVLTLNGRRSSFLLRDVRRVEVFGRAGDDSIHAVSDVPASYFESPAESGFTGDTRAPNASSSLFIVPRPGTIVRIPILMSGGSGDDTLHGGSGDDTLIGGSGHDVVSGGAGHDELGGVSGNDTLRGCDGDDFLDGGSGDDVVGADDFLPDREAGHDTLFGSAGNDTLHGGGGDDSVNGGSGDDVLRHWQGSDFLAGGPGTDTFVTRTTSVPFTTRSRSGLELFEEQVRLVIRRV